MDNLEANSISSLSIGGNHSLTYCEVQSICDYLASPNGIIAIYGNAMGCNSPPEIANDCGITLPCLPFGDYHFNSQSEIDDFAINYPNCTVLEGRVIIQGDDITNLNGLSVLTSIGGDLTIGGWDNNPSLTSLTGLDNVTSIGGSISIANNDALTSLTGLENITSIQGSLIIGGDSYYIWGNNSLPNLSGLDNVTYIGGGIWINGNNALTSLSGLDNIDADSILSLEINKNPNLSHCSVLSICNYLSNPNGTIVIVENTTGCDSQEEVQDSCYWVSVDEIYVTNNLYLFPNPSSTQITIELSRTPEKNTSLTIYNLNGQQLITQRITKLQTVVDISGLTKGVYFVKVVNDEKVMMGKVVKN